MAFYRTGGGGGGVSLYITDSISMAIPCNGDTVINVKDYDQDAELAVGLNITVSEVSGASWGGSATLVGTVFTAKTNGGQNGNMTCDGTNVHIKTLPSAGTTFVTSKVSCTLTVAYVK